MISLRNLFEPFTDINVLSFTYSRYLQSMLNPLSASITKWSNTLKKFVGKLPTNCLSVFDHFVELALKELTNILYFNASCYFEKQTLKFKFSKSSNTNTLSRKKKITLILMLCAVFQISRQKTNTIWNREKRRQPSKNEDDWIPVKYLNVLHQNRTKKQLWH